MRDFWEEWHELNLNNDQKPCQSPVIKSMSQINEFEYKSLSKLIKMSNKVWDKLFKEKEIRNGKMNWVKSSLDNQENKNRSIKKV